MNRRNLPLAALRSFEAAARLGSFKLAAAELAVTPTAISHQVRALEDQVGVKLFERQVRRVVLTEKGTVLLAVLTEGFDSIESALRRLVDSDDRARVTVSGTSAFIAKWLLPRLGRFRKENPGIDLRMLASEEPVDLRSRTVDVAIRYGRGPYPGVVAQALFADRFAPVSSPGLKMNSPADLARAPLIEFSWKRHHAGNPTWQKWFSSIGLPWPKNPNILQFSDEAHAIQAAIAGHGVALLSLALVGDEVRQGLLTSPFDASLPGHTYHVLIDAPRANEPHLRHVSDWLQAEGRQT